jgi:hypothetical protein
MRNPFHQTVSQDIAIGILNLRLVRNAMWGLMEN